MNRTYLSLCVVFTLLGGCSNSTKESPDGDTHPTGADGSHVKGDSIGSSVDVSPIVLLDGGSDALFAVDGGLDMGTILNPDASNTIADAALDLNALSDAPIFLADAVDGSPLLLPDGGPDAVVAADGGLDMGTILNPDASNTIADAALDSNALADAAGEVRNSGGTLGGAPVVSGTITGGSKDSYTFVANAGEGIQLRMVDVAAGAFTPTMAVYAPNGTALATVSGTEVAASAFSAPSTGTYTVVVYDGSAGAATTGDYQLYFTKAPGANEGGLLSPGGVVTGTIDKGDLDSYTFVANIGEGIQLRMVDVAAGAFTPTMAIYAPNGTALATVSGTEVAAGAFSAPSTGTYTVVVYDWSSGAAATGDYQLYFTKAPGANEGGLLSPGGVVTGTIDKGDLDSYTFVANIGEGIQLRMVDVAAGAFTPTMAIYAPNGTALATVSGTEVAAGAFSAPSTGTYTVVVYDWSSGAAATGDYQLYFTKAPGANEGGLLSPGGVVTGTIDKGDLDSYTFVANIGEGIQLRMVDVAAGAFTPTMAIYAPNGTALATVSGTEVAAGAFSAPSTGTYTVVVYDWSSGAAATGDYQLYFTKAPGANEGGLLSPGGVVTGTIDKGDLDSYTFVANIGEGIQLRMVDVAAGAFTPTMAIYAPNGTALATVSGTEVAAGAFSAPSTGTYTVVVYDWSSGAAATGDYQLTFTKTPGAS